MAANQYGLGAFTHPQLSKESIRAGFLLWLRSEINEGNLISLTAPRLETWSLEHPVVVIDMLEDSPSDVQICAV